MTDFWWCYLLLPYLIASWTLNCSISMCLRLTVDKVAVVNRTSLFLLTLRWRDVQTETAFLFFAFSRSSVSSFTGRMAAWCVLNRDVFPNVQSIVSSSWQWIYKQGLTKLGSVLRASKSRYVSGLPVKRPNWLFPSIGTCNVTGHQTFHHFWSTVILFFATVTDH